MEMRPTLEGLPPKVLSNIYIHTRGDSNVEVEAAEDGALLTNHCKLLRVSRQLRQSILQACDVQSSSLELVYTVRSPAALINLLSPNTATHPLTLDLPIRNLRVLVAAPFEEIITDISYDEQVGRPEYAVAVKRIVRGWRDGFKLLPHDVRMVYFDFARNFNKDADAAKRIPWDLSLLMHRRTFGKARSRVTSCKSRKELADIERFTTNAIPSGARKKRDDKPEETSGGDEMETA